MNDMTPFRKRTTTEIRSDRDLLAELGMSDAVAASYLGKSRQALNLKLGPKRVGAMREPYFKISEILVLVMAARQRGQEFDEEAVREFIDDTASERAGQSDESLKLLDQLLSGVKDIDVTDAGTVVMILPAFADQRAQLPDFSKDLRRLAETLGEMQPVPWVTVFSSTKMQAQMAVEWLKLPMDKTRWFTHEYVDHYVPSVLVFSKKGGDPRPYVLTERGGLIQAPQFRAHTLAECVRFMLPPEARKELFTHEEDDEVTPRRRA